MPSHSSLGRQRHSDWEESPGQVTAWRHRSPLGLRLRHALGRDWAAALAFVLPSMIILGALIAYPFFRALFLSFTRTHGREIGPWVGLDNYRALWRDKFFRRSVGITLRYAGWSVALSLGIAMLAAILLHQLGTKAELLTGLLLLPWVMPEIVRAITWKGLLDPLYGTINRILLNLDLIERPFAFFGDVRTALGSVILVNVWQRLPFFLINLLAGLKSIDPALYEAAAIDGAGPWQRMVHITAPSIRYVILIVVLLGGIWSLNEFNLIFLLTGGGPMGATQLYSVLAYNYSRTRVGMGSAVALCMAPAFVALVALLQRHILPGQPGQGVTRRWRVAAWGTDQSARARHALAETIDPLRQTSRKRAEKRQSRRAKQPPLSRKALRRRRLVSRFATQSASWLALILLLVFEILPLYWVVITSFKNELQITMFESVLWPKPWCSDQFERLFGPQNSFVSWIINTLGLALVTPLVSTSLAALGAYAVARLKWRGARLYAQAVLLSYLMPIVLLIVPIYQLFVRLGLVNRLLSLYLAYPTITLPFALWLLIGYYQTLPIALEDAASVDGCNHWQSFWMIILPLSKPALVAATIFGFSQVWSEFMFATNFIRLERLMTVAQGLATLSFGDIQPWGQLAAAALVLSCPALLIYATGQRFMLAGLTAGAIKG